MELLRISDTLKLVPAQSSGRYPYALAIYVDAERKILIDVGMGPKLMAAFTEQFKVDIVLLSHTHVAHLAGLGSLDSKVPVFAPKEGSATSGRLDALAERFIDDPAVRNVYKGLARQVQGYRDAYFSHSYDGRSAFDLGSVRLVALHTPGHTMDHYCFFDDISGTMLLFDIDLDPFGPRYGNPESDIAKFEASIGLVRSYNPEVAVSSHFGVLRKDVDRHLENFQNQFSIRDEMVFKALVQPITLDALAETGLLLAPHAPVLKPLFSYWQKQMLLKHLDRLLERREIRRNGKEYFKA